LVKAFTSTELKSGEIKGYSYQEEKVSYGGIYQRWLLLESADSRKCRHKKSRLKEINPKHSRGVSENQ
jgi:hypothetical protein